MYTRYMLHISDVIDDWSVIDDLSPRLWDIDAAECKDIVEDPAAKHEIMSLFNYQDYLTLEDSPIMMVKSMDGEGQVVQVFKPSTNGDKVSRVWMF